MTRFVFDVLAAAVSGGLTTWTLYWRAHWRRTIAGGGNLDNIDCAAWIFGLRGVAWCLLAVGCTGGEGRIIGAFSAALAIVAAAIAYLLLVNAVPATAHANWTASCSPSRA